jgi:tetratricopeptide (TPR) repeat protein
MLALCGCRLPGRDGPVPQSVANCRQLSQQGVAAMERGQWQKAEETLAKAVKACPVDIEARRRYAETLWQRNARPEAIAQLEEAVRLSGDDSAIQARLAEMYLAQSQVDTARRHAEQAVVLNPKLVAAWAVHARVQRAMGKPQEALADCHRALRYAPDDRTILLELAELYGELNQPEREIQTLQTLSDLYPPGEEPQRLLCLSGAAYVALRRYQEAAECYASAVSRGPPDAEILYRLADAQWSAGRIAEADAAVRQALACKPDHKAGRELLGRIEIARGERNSQLR